MNANIIPTRRLSFLVLAITSAWTIGDIVMSAEPPASNISERAAVPAEPSVPLPLTEADYDPDVSKRPRFLAALKKARIAPAMFKFGSPSLTRDSVPTDEWDAFHYFLEQVVREESLPDTWESASETGYADSSGIAEIQVITWGSTLGEIVASRGRKYDTLSIRLQVAPGRRLAFLPPVNGDHSAGPWEVDGKTFFDDVALHKLVTGLLRIPFTGSDDFVIRLRSDVPREIEGVRIADGSILSKSPFEEKTGSGERPWYSRIPFLITDSDPQYIGFAIDFRAEAKELDRTER